MAFDVDAFRKAAEAAGISKAEIENEIKFQTSAPAKTDPFEKDEGGFKLGSLEQVQERLGNDWWHLPAALAFVSAGIYGASKLMDDGDTPRPPPPPPPPPPPGGPGMRIDPTFDVEPLPQQAPAPAPDRLQQAQQIIEANKQLGLGSKPVPPVVPPQFPPAGVPAGDIPPAPPYQPSTPITAAPVDAPAPTPTSGPGSPVTTIVNDTVKEMIQEAPQELRTGTGKPAFAGMAPPPKIREKGGMAGKPIFKNTYARPEDVPTGYAFVPNAQFIDPGRQDMGQPLFTKTYSAQEYPLTDKMAREQASEINRMLGRPTRAELKAAGLEAAPNTPGITQYINQPKGSGMGTKTVKVGGALGALVAIPDLAKAETAGQRAMAGANLLEAVLPPGFMMSGAGQGSSNVPSFDQAVLLGSPYAQTEFSKRKRQEQEYNRKINRAVPPPFMR